ncbi:MAG TPA: ankyrin repeat domain-containing protein [Leptospiraceae bacterium]|nr:ankyrin repeat domain-containing protein [Leptospiraceae bacterium]
MTFTVYADPNIELLSSASIGDLDGVKKSLAQNADINFRDSLGTSALMFAANNNHFPVVKFLVDNKADVFAKNTNGWTAAVMAGARGNTFIKEFLEGTERKIVASRSSGVILALVGDVTVGNKKINVGDIVEENQTIFVGKKSYCDLQVKQSLSNFTIRVRENSVFSLKFKEKPDENVYSGFLKFGSALFKVGKVFSGERIEVISPTAIAAVRGTIFDTSVANDGSTKLNVQEGFVQTRIRAPEAEDDTTIEDTIEMKRLTENLERNAQLVPYGYSVETSPKNQRDVLQKMDAENLVKRAKRKEYSTTSIQEVNLKCSEKPKLKKGIEESSVKRSREESESLIGIDGSKLRNTWDRSDLLNLIQNRKVSQDSSNARAQVIRQPEKIKLKNGSVITGSIYQLDNQYFLISEQGEQKINEADIDVVYFN